MAFYFSKFEIYVHVLSTKQRDGILWDSSILPKAIDKGLVSVVSGFSQVPRLLWDGPFMITLSTSILAILICPEDVCSLKEAHLEDS